MPKRKGKSETPERNEAVHLVRLNSDRWEKSWGYGQDFIMWRERKRSKFCNLTDTKNPSDCTSTEDAKEGDSSVVLDLTAVDDSDDTDEQNLEVGLRKPLTDGSIRPNIRGSSASSSILSLLRDTGSSSSDSSSDSSDDNLNLASLWSDSSSDASLSSASTSDSSLSSDSNWSSNSSDYDTNLAQHNRRINRTWRGF
jgi:hypothetical protein